LAGAAYSDAFSKVRRGGDKGRPRVMGRVRGRALNERVRKSGRDRRE